MAPVVVAKRPSARPPPSLLAAFYVALYEKIMRTYLVQLS